MAPNGTTISTSSFPTEKHLLVRTIVMVASCLAMIGAVFVILSYMCFKSLRSQARQILVNLSLMDFGIGIANFTGAIINFDQYYKDTINTTSLIGPPSMDKFCKAQAFVALFTTYASFFWTISLAIYMYTIIIQNWNQKTRFYLPACYILCYGLAIGLALWLLFTSRLGHAPYNSSGWCSIIIVWPGNRNIDYMAATFGYDLWIYLTFFICLTIYPVIVLQMNVEYRGAIQLVGLRTFWKRALEFLNFKFLLIPIAFFVLRIWTCILNIIFVYCRVDPDSLPGWLCMLLIILAGIGDSSQGLANGLIFVFFTNSVRRKFTSLKSCHRCNYCLTIKRHDEMYEEEESSRLMSSGRLQEEARRKSPYSIVTPTSSLLN